jgi:ankyrin repeat protein
LKHANLNVNFQTNNDDADNEYWESQNGRTALILATQNGHTDTVVELLKHDKVDVNIQDIHGDTAFLWQCRLTMSTSLSKC